MTVHGKRRPHRDRRRRRRSTGARARGAAHRLAVDRRPHRVAQPEPRGHGRARAARHAHRAGRGGHVDPAAAALSAGTRRQADRRSRPRHRRSGDARRRHRRRVPAGVPRRPGPDRRTRAPHQRDDPAAAPAVDGRGDHPRRPLLPDGRREDPPGAGPAGRPADHRRRPEGARDAPSGDARRRLVPLHVLAPPLRRFGGDHPPDRRRCRARPLASSTGACGCSSTSTRTAMSRASKPRARWVGPTTRTSSR